MTIPNNWYIADCTSEVYPTSKMDAGTFYPVSYTHLDVYKRQCWSDMDGHLRRRRIMQRMGSVDKIKKLSDRYCSYGVLLEIVNAIYVVIIIPCTILLSSTLTKMLVIGITVVIGIFGFILGYLLDMYGDYLSLIHIYRNS